VFKKIIQYIALIKFKLTSLKNVHHLTKNTWQATNNDPQLMIRSPFFLKGWYFIKLRVKSNSNSLQTAKIYVNYGKGYSENFSFAIHQHPKKSTSKVIYLSKRVKSLRLDPVESQIDFTIEELKIFRITEALAKKKIFKRIAKLHPGHSHLTPHKIKSNILKQSKKKWRNEAIEIYKETFSRSIVEENYQHWIKIKEVRHQSTINTLISNITSAEKISIILPTFNSNVDYLKQCIESVQQQSYKNWQLCIVDDASTHTDHIRLIRQKFTEDPRIQFHQRKENGHISAASNSALKMATGKYTLLLDHDDTLALHALLLMVSQFQQSPKLDLVYADEDKISTNNTRFEPHFKPEWNQDLLYSQNYIGHPILVKTKKLKSMGGFSLGLEGSQDHDLLLRYTSELTKEHIHRIPQILYHWRAHDESTAGNSAAKSYTTKAGIKALQNHFHSKKQPVTISQGKLANTYRVQWPIPSKQPLVSLIIPTHNGYDILSKCINSIITKTSYKNYEIIIINNRSNCQKTLKFIREAVKKNTQVQSIDWDHPFNYSAINNFAAKHAHGSILGLINNDIEVINTSWLTEMVSHAIRPDIGCVGSKLYYPNNQIQHAGVILGIGGVAGHGHKHFQREQSGYFSKLELIQNYSAVTAACLLIQKSIFNQVNGLDQQNLPIAFNDVDFCIRVRNAGYRNIWTPYAELYHHESISRGADNTPEKIQRANKEVEYMKSTWTKHLTQDPAYNPNLSLTHENYSIKSI